MSGSRPRRLIGALVAISLALSSVPSAAQPSAAEKETARRLVKSGRQKKKAGELEAALEDFRSAHAIMKLPITGLELGKAELEAEQLVEARDTLLAVSRMQPEPGEAPAAAKARDEAKTLAKSIEPKIPQLRVKLENPPTGVRIHVDDTEVQSATLAAPLSVNPGTHVIKASLDGRDKREEVTLAAGEARTVVLDLAALGAGEKSDPTSAAPEPAHATSATNPLVYIGFGIAGAGVLVGSVTGVLALSKASAAKKDCDDSECPPSTHDDIDSGRTYGTISTVAFAVGAVGAGIGIYGLLNPSAAPSRERAPGAASTSIWIGVGQVGARGTF